MIHYRIPNGGRLFFTRLLLFFFMAIPYCTIAQTPLTANERSQVIDSLGKRLKDYYIFPKMADEMVGAIATHAAHGKYTAIPDPRTLAETLTADLVNVSHDKHLNVTFDPGWVTASKKVLTLQDSVELWKMDYPDGRLVNYGFKEIKILEGNIGYLNLTEFFNPSYGGETAVAAMKFLENTDALIIDLRTNGGGFGEMVQLLASYFFEAARHVLLLEMYARATNSVTQDYILPYIPGKRLPDIALYILTSNRTFSAAESFTYFLKNQKRAVSIGETTGGGAHPIDHIAVTDRFSLFVPSSKPIDPITKTNWEGKGVSPDIATPAKDALLTAHIKALEKLAASHPDSNYTYTWALAGLQARQNPVSILPAVLKTYAGNYGNRKLTLENNGLFYQKENNEKHRLVPITTDLFILENVPELRIKMIREQDKVTALLRLYENGDSARNNRE
jgi:hypothetical protein